MTYQDQENQIAELLEFKLGIRGKGLDRKLRKAGRALPKSVHRDANIVMDAARLQNNPKLARMVDDAQVQRAHAACETYLSAIDPWHRRQSAILGFLSTNAFNILAISAAVIAVMAWRGLI